MHNDMIRPSGTHRDFDPRNVPEPCPSNIVLYQSTIAQLYVQTYGLCIFFLGFGLELGSCAGCKLADRLSL
jgi:hypothetical protein